VTKDYQAIGSLFHFIASQNSSSVFINQLT